VDGPFGQLMVCQVKIVGASSIWGGQPEDCTIDSNKYQDIDGVLLLFGWIENTIHKNMPGSMYRLLGPIKGICDKPA